MRIDLLKPLVQVYRLKNMHEQLGYMELDNVKLNL